MAGVSLWPCPLWCFTLLLWVSVSQVQIQTRPQFSRDQRISWKAAKPQGWVFISHQRDRCFHRTLTWIHNGDIRDHWACVKGG